LTGSHRHNQYNLCDAYINFGRVGETDTLRAIGVAGGRRACDWSAVRAGNAPRSLPARHTRPFDLGPCPPRSSPRFDPCTPPSLSLRVAFPSDTVPSRLSCPAVADSLRPVSTPPENPSNTDSRGPCDRYVSSDEISQM